MKFLWSVLFILALSATAFAERYMVVLKNRSTFNNVHSQLTLAKSSRLESTKEFASFSMAVEGSLVHLSTFIVNSSNLPLVQALARHPEVAFVEKEKVHRAPIPVRGYKISKPWNFRGPLPRTRQPLPGTRSPVVGAGTPYGVVMVKAPAVWARGFRGQNIRVAILDTGIDKDHPALASQIESTKDFVGDKNGPYDVADHEGHGSHVAGTVAALPFSDGFVGVAPQARLLIGRVCNEDGCSTASVVAGINWAIAQKADVLNMSLGGKAGSQGEKLALAAAEKAGMVVVAASGNAGEPQVGSPAAFPDVLAVGAVDKAGVKADFSQWGPELSLVAPGVDIQSSVPKATGRDTQVSLTIDGLAKPVPASSFEGSLEVPAGLSGNLVDAGLGRPEELAAAKALGKMVLIRRGEFKFSEKAKNAIAAGATGVVLYNTQPGLVHGTSITSDGATLSIPVVMIEQVSGEAVQKVLAAGGQVSASIRTIPSDFGVMSGTSMATPHVTGVVALIRSANKNLSPAQVRDVLKSTCRTLGPNPHNEYGKGLVDSQAAVAKALSIR